MRCSRKILLKRLQRLILAILTGWWMTSCGQRDSQETVLTAEMPLHLEEHLDEATIEGSKVPAEIPEPVEWRFDRAQPDWKVIAPFESGVDPVQTTRTEDALRLVFTEANRTVRPWGSVLSGGVYIDLPDWNREDWAYVEVEARTEGQGHSLALRFNLGEESHRVAGPFRHIGEYTSFVNDGSARTYRMRADWSYSSLDDWEGPWRQLGIAMSTREPSNIDLLSVRLIPKASKYASAGFGVGNEIRKEWNRRVLYTHTPGKVSFEVLVPEKGRFDVGLGVLRADAPVKFRIDAKPQGSDAVTLLEETVSDKDAWTQRSVDLSQMEGQQIHLTLETDAGREGIVALWSAPTITGSRKSDRPNVVLYIIDAAGADYMSVYGYNRRTTPHLSRIAEQGAVFERAYSNSTWTKPSTASFMTSLHHSVLGGYQSDTDPIPDQSVTLAEQLHRFGYQTAVLTSNTYAGTLSGLERGVDVLREAGTEFNSTSSAELHERFWQWREMYPGEPYWIHFQTTDVHWPWNPAAPFAGLFVSSELRDRFYGWEQRLATASGLEGPRWLEPWLYSPEAYEKVGVDRQALFQVARGLYDEVMAHNDEQIDRLVKRLKISGEWENTLFIVSADHAERHNLGLLDPLPPRWIPNLNSATSRVPLIVVWPGRIAPGQRFTQPVSMIDIVPTILDLTNLPMPKVMQGQSLGPLLLGEEGWQPRPVILDEFYRNAETGELGGLIEVIDGRWGASLEINPDPDRPPERRRPAPLLLYNLWNDPNCLNSLHEKRPDLVDKYTTFLKEQWEAHLSLAQHFSHGGEQPLTPEQLQTLRALGYIQ